MAQKTFLNNDLDLVSKNRGQLQLKFTLTLDQNITRGVIATIFFMGVYSF